MINLNEHKKRYRKHSVTILLASILISSLFVGAALGFLTNQSTFTNHAQYVVLEGVAGNDYYDSRQYSYQVNQWANETVCGTYGSATTNPNPANVWFRADKSLRIGFTEFGEFATKNNSGIAYGWNSAEWANSESWSSTGIPSQYWIQGWVFYMNYTRQTILRQVEAYAVYSDTVNTEAGRGVYSWLGDRAPNAAGALLTAGTLTPSGVQVLYDSARLVVVRASVVIHDNYYNEDVAKITFTVIYNKDSKYAIVYKDVKILLQPKILDSINEFAFSERYEIDLAYLINPTNQAYIHWFHNYNASVYQHPLTGSNMTDVVQAFDVHRNYIFFAGYWPNVTEYSVYAALVPNLPVVGYTGILPVGTAQADMPNEPATPWVIAQWRYQSINAAYPNYYPHLLNFLAKGVPDREIRFVEVFGMTDYNLPTTSNSISAGAANGYNNNFYNAKDLNASDNFNSLDIEVRYMLYGKVFVPEDLRSINTQPFQWIGMGQSAATTDSAGAAALADLNQQILQNPLGLFDRNDTAFPWTAPTITNKGSIPYGLDNGGNFVNYLETFNNVAKGTGTDPTSFIRTGLNGFAFDRYDGTSGRSPPQPIAGGYSASSTYWYPSKDPLTERWSTPFPNTNQPNALYGGINYHPNGIITLGGEKANGLTRYFNDFNFAITREGTTSEALAQNNVVTGSAPTSNPSVNTFDYLPLSTWASSQTTFGYNNINDTIGYAVLALARDINGTRGLSVYGWDARDTYWAAAWGSQYLGVYVNNGWIPAGTVALVISISYPSANQEPSAFTVLKALGTITEFGTNLFVTNYLGFDAITGPATWNGLVSPPSLPNVNQAYKVWWYEKLPTTSTAKVQFDP